MDAVVDMNGQDSGAQPETRHVCSNAVWLQVIVFSGCPFRGGRIRENGGTIEPDRLVIVAVIHVEFEGIGVAPAEGPFFPASSR